MHGKEVDRTGNLHLVCISRICVRYILCLVASVVNNDTTTSLIYRDTIPGSTKVKNLASLVLCLCSSDHIAYLNVRQAVSLNSSDASTLIELDLPDSTEIRQQILDELARIDVPHLKRAVGA
jgi:hypothetical protein